MNAKTKNEFLTAYESYADAIYRHCFFRVFQAAKAEELTQEAFLRMWEYLRNGNSVDNMRAFLYRVANNLIIDNVRKKKEDSLEAVLEKNPALDPIMDGQAKADQQVALRDIFEAMAHLPPDVRELLTYRYVDDLDPKDIAEILEITPNNVSVKLNRAMKALKNELGDYTNETE